MLNIFVLPDSNDSSTETYHKSDERSSTIYYRVLGLKLSRILALKPFKFFKQSQKVTLVEFPVKSHYEYFLSSKEIIPMLYLTFSLYSKINVVSHYQTRNNIINIITSL